MFDTFEVSQSPMGDAERIHAQCGRCGKAFSPREVQRLSEALDGGGGIVPRDRDAADEVECKPVRPLIADLLRDRLALDRGGLGTVEPCGPQVEGRGGQQGRGACLGSLGDGGEGLLQPPVALLEVDPAQPERPEGDAEAQCLRLVDREERVERGLEVRRLAVEPRVVALPLGEIESPVRVASGKARRLTGLIEPFAGVEADRLEQPVAAVADAVVARDERLLDQPRQDVGDLTPFEAVTGAHRLDRGEVEAPGEDGQAAKERPLVVREQLVAPLEGRLERLLARRRRAAARAQQPEAVVQPLCDRVRPQRAEAGRGELDREREAVEPVADANHVAGVPVLEGEAGGGGARPLDEQADRLVAEEVGRARPAPPGSGIASDGTRKTVSPWTRSGSRLVATTETPGAERSSTSATAAAATRTCSQLSSTSRSDRPPRNSATAASRSWPGSARTSSAAATASWTCAGSATGASSTSTAPSANEASTPRASSSASRVLPGAARAGEREEPRAGQEGSELVELALAADERRRVDRQAADALDCAELAQLVGEGRRQLGQLVAPGLDPVLIAVLGEELAAVQRERRPVGGRSPRPAGVDRRPLELVDVHDDVGGEVEQLVAQLDRVGAQCAAGDVEGLVEVVRRGVRALLTPEGVHRLLAVEAMLRRERQQLHQLARLLQSPGPVRDGVTVGHGAEASEQLDPRFGHPDTG